MDRAKEYSFVLSTMPRLHAHSRLLELRVYKFEVLNDDKSHMPFTTLLQYTILSVLGKG